MLRRIAGLTAIAVTVALTLLSAGTQAQSL